MKTIVLTGAAASGKTKIINMLLSDLLHNGYDALMLSETATEMMRGGFPARRRVVLFQKTLFDLQYARENAYMEYLESVSDDSVCLLDRSLADGSIYTARSDYVRFASRYGLTLESILDRYDAVIQLQPSVLVCEYDRESNNNVRLETSGAECLTQDEALRGLYSAHRNYFYVAAEINFDDKYKNVLKIVEGILGNRTGKKAG